jgi:hypothetical protein
LESKIEQIKKEYEGKHLQRLEALDKLQYQILGTHRIIEQFTDTESKFKTLNAVTVGVLSLWDAALLKKSSFQRELGEKKVRIGVNVGIRTVEKLCQGRCTFGFCFEYNPRKICERRSFHCSRT